jgi:hypothetical protein
MPTTFNLIREDPNVSESLKAIVLLLAGNTHYKVELEEKWIGHLREGKLFVKCERWLTRNFKHWQDEADIAIVVYSLLRASQCLEVRNLRYDCVPDSEYATFRFEVVV